MNKPVGRMAQIGMLGGVLLIAGIVLGLKPVGSGCGSVFRPSGVAALYDTMTGFDTAGACEVARSHMMVPVWLLVAFGALTILAAVLVHQIVAYLGES